MRRCRRRRRAAPRPEGRGGASRREARARATPPPGARSARTPRASSLAFFAFAPSFASSLRRMSPSASATSAKARAARTRPRAPRFARPRPGGRRRRPARARSPRASPAREPSRRGASLPAAPERIGPPRRRARRAHALRTAPVSASTYACRIATRSTALGNTAASQSSRRVFDQSATPAPSAPVSNASRTISKSTTFAACNTKRTLLATRGGSTERSETVVETRLRPFTASACFVRSSSRSRADPLFEDADARSSRSSRSSRS